VKRAPAEAAPAPPAPPPVAASARKNPSKPATRKSLTPRAPSRKSIPALRLPKESKAPPPLLGAPAGEQVASDPLLRPAVIKPQPRPNFAEAAALMSAAGDVDALLAGARSAGASDLHLVAGRPPLLRVAGELLPRGATLEPATVEAMLMPLVPERLAQVLAEQGSCDFAIERGASGRFRVNVGRQRTGLKACFRLVPPAVPTLESLGLPPEIEKATHHHQGLVIVTGPTGHGKTCTLAAIVDIINRTKTHHIITVEDPVEVIHPRKKAMISQREIGSHTRSFAAALKASLREDPDVIVVGELRDTETVRMALAASETGHLVLGTMNTPSAAKTIDRLIDLFPPGDQAQVRITLAGGLHLVVSQRLLPRADGRGMVAAVELLPGSVALWSLIRDSKTFQIPSLQQRGRGFGILRLDESLAELVRAGKVAREAALAVAEAPGKLGV
jgi:twitching motility protein PilT